MRDSIARVMGGGRGVFRLKAGSCLRVLLRVSLSSSGGLGIAGLEVVAVLMCSRILYVYGPRARGDSPPHGEEAPV